MHGNALTKVDRTSLEQNFYAVFDRIFPSNPLPNELVDMIEKFTITPVDFGKVHQLLTPLVLKKMWLMKKMFLRRPINYYSFNSFLGSGIGI